VDLRASVNRARRATKHSPRYLMRRLVEVGSARLRRPWSRVYPHLLTDRAILRAAGAPSIDALWERQQQAPFFVAPANRQDWVGTFRSRYPDAPGAIVAAADRVLRHEFDLLGSGSVNLGLKLPWHSDFKTGREWPLQFSPHINYQELDRPTDIKVPWELSRCQHFTALGQAYWLTDDERYAQEFASEVHDWISRNPWGHGVNWACAMDVALRAVSWIWGFYYMSGSAACASRAFRGEFLRGLYLHGEHVDTYIERADVNGNHYLCDGVGLVFLGAFFRSTRTGRRWLQTGTELIAGEIFNQTTEDGVDFEQSTAYHRLVLEAFLTCGLLLDLHGEPLPSEWRVRLERMLEFVEAYVKPDGTVPLTGDADDGRIQKLGHQGINDHRYLLSTGAVLFGRSDFKRAAGQFWDESFWLLGPSAADRFDDLPAAVTPIESKAFPDGGFFVLRSDRAHVMIDCGEVGMRGRGGHGHNDILSMEVWLGGMNLITDCGSYLYTASREWRNRFRSTAFHNVVQVDGEEMNRFLVPESMWQLRYDAQPQGLVWQCGEDVDYFRGGHSGYARLTPPVAVVREVWLAREGPDVFVRDCVSGSDSRDLVWRFHVDPALDVEIDRHDIRLGAAGRDAWLQIVDAAPGSTVAIEDGWVSPSYGVRVNTHVVVIATRTSLPVLATYRIGLVRLAAARLQTLAFSLAVKRQESLVRR
jgi:hypothetical protein